MKFATDLLFITIQKMSVTVRKADNEKSSLKVVLDWVLKFPRAKELDTGNGLGGWAN